MLITTLTDDQVIRMGKLAVLASSPMGLGYLHANPDLAESAIDISIRGEARPGLVIDYYEGRMVKFRAWKRADGWEFPDTISADYESWIHTYPSYAELASAAQEQP